MAPNHPENPNKKRKQPINGLKRDQPLFAQRKPNPSLQQPPDFLTDSLNTSYIPSPSPPKSPTRQNVHPRPRQTVASSKSLATAFKATAKVDDENRPSSSSSSDRKRSSQSLKPHPIQTIPRAKSRSPSKPARSPVRARTPSPLRGRAASITSPAASESSPPRGYAEAYQRIVEEENLAQEESVEDMEDITGYDFNGQDRSQDLDRMRLQRIQHSASPVSLRASRRASPAGAVGGVAQGDVDNKENVGHDSDGESSASYMENITDTSIDSGSSQYAKDLQRLQGALNSGRKAFSKARVGDRVGLTIDNLQRKGSNDSLGSAFSAGSLSNRGSDPSVNVPKAWGRKAKPGKDWLSRINSRSGKLTGDVPKRHSSGDQIIAENQKRERGEPIDEWITDAAEIPLPSVEGSSQTALSSQGSTPTTAVQRTTSLDRLRQWEVTDDEFTGRSFQVSDSPPIRIRSGTLDRIREREIESVEKRAVATSRLGELRKKSSAESLRRRIGFEVEDGDGPREASPQRQESGKSTLQPEQQRPDENNAQEPTLQSEQQRPDENNAQEPTSEDTGEAIPDTPIVIYRANSTGIVSSSENSSRPRESKLQNSRRPSHERKDSHDLLKRLAKATSESPSPAKQSNEPGQLPNTEGQDQVQQTPQNPRPSSNLKTPVITGAWVDQTMEATPQLSRADVNLKTPLVTGAWIDTPLPTGGRGPPMPTPSDAQDDKELSNGKLGAAELIHRLGPNSISARPKLRNQAPLKYSGPPLAKSALQEIINDARAPKRRKRPSKTSSGSESEEDPTLHLGDSTIQSLEELIANDEDFSTLLAPTPPSPETAPSSSEPSPSSQTLTTTSQSSDLQSYTHLLSRLTNLAPSLRASKTQLASLQRTLSASPPTNNNQPSSSECPEAGEFHDFIWPCQRCGCPGRMDPDLRPLLLLRDHLTSITIPVPRLWRWRSRNRPPRLTWLGALALLAWILYCAEMWARARFCHPVYARSMVGYGVDINAPRPPFVLAKVVYRYTALGSLVAPFYHLVRVLLRLGAGAVGYLVGFAAGDGGATRAAGGMDQGVLGSEWGVQLGMADDEFL
ncbi:hypothetical protein IMSHALPRED_003429 [Imshaugia aleurites]|uniref:Uncharacterized protein n=1 Tax=Imshaugia aleurites TaxID=172621 RepID=A0A8H3J7U8_9LECA|nr:hypothetical protein IMSHALPRED_003429 [Imshaugia aleurites]